MIVHHRPQLEDGERAAAETRAPLTIKNRSGWVELDENRADAECSGNDRQTKQSYRQITRPTHALSRDRKQIYPSE